MHPPTGVCTGCQEGGLLDVITVSRLLGVQARGTTTYTSPLSALRRKLWSRDSSSLHLLHHQSPHFFFGRFGDNIPRLASLASLCSGLLEKGIPSPGRNIPSSDALVVADTFRSARERRGRCAFLRSSPTFSLTGRLCHHGSALFTNPNFERHNSGTEKPLLESAGRSQ